MTVHKGHVPFTKIHRACTAMPEPNTHTCMEHNECASLPRIHHTHHCRPRGDAPPAVRPPTRTTPPILSCTFETRQTPDATFEHRFGKLAFMRSFCAYFQGHRPSVESYSSFDVYGLYHRFFAAQTRTVLWWLMYQHAHAALRPACGIRLCVAISCWRAVVVVACVILACFCYMGRVGDCHSLKASRLYMLSHT